MQLSKLQPMYVVPLARPLDYNRINWMQLIECNWGASIDFHRWKDPNYCICFISSVFFNNLPPREDFLSFRLCLVCFSIFNSSALLIYVFVRFKWSLSDSKVNRLSCGSVIRCNFLFWFVFSGLDFKVAFSHWWEICFPLLIVSVYFDLVMKFV